MSENGREKLEQWLLRSAIAAAVFFGGKWVGRVDKLVDDSPARLAAAETSILEFKGNLGHFLKLQEAMLTNQLEMNQFLAKEYGNKDLAKKFQNQLEDVKAETANR